MKGTLKLYSYWRSSAAYRVRIGLNLKGLAYDTVPVHLVRDGGEQHSEAYRRTNPQELVPALEQGGEGRDGEVFQQSMAILEYLDETWPAPSLLPADARGRARVRALAQAVACDIHPLNNLRVLQYLENALGLDADACTEWVRHWIGTGFAAIEKMLAGDPATGRYCHGDTPSMADCCLVAQVYNARRFKLDMAPYPTIGRIDAACLELPAFDAARPENQPDAPSRNT